MTSIAAILAAATDYVWVQNFTGPNTPDGVVVSGQLGTVAKADNGQWHVYVPVSSQDTPRYPCSGWPI